MKKEWDIEVNGVAMYRQVKRLKNMKQHLKKLSWKNGNLFENVKKLKEELKIAQLEVDKFPFDPVIKANEANLLDKYIEAVDDEEKLLFQMAKIDWISKGDKNSSYFHKVVMGKKHTNRVMSICDEQGNIFEGEEVARKFVEHFQSFLGKKDIVEDMSNMEDLFTSKLSETEAIGMIREVTDNEIKEAVFEIGDMKAPGPDGFSSVFFKKSWGVIGADVCAAIKEFFITGKLLKEINATVITLVPKTQQPLKVSEFRPISCCNVIYKMISKILTNRIKDGLHKIVNLNQSAFIPGRLIQDNLLITQELLKGYNRKNGPKRCALKIDIAKAYDTVD